jgi:pimeloyl-ACP methyl ester carboxylesterase
MGRWSSGFIDVGGVRIHYTRTGGDHPPLVMAHGFSDSGLCWAPIAEQLEAGYDVVMPDARCHGLSDAPMGTFGAREQAADLAGVIEGLGLVKPTVLGHSMGAATALALAGLRPELPRAILLEDPPALWMPRTGDPGADGQWIARTREWVLRLKGQAREQILADQRAATPGWSEAELEPWADSKLQLHLNVFNRDRSDVDWPAIVAQVRCPVLLVTADPDRGSLVTGEQAAALKAKVPHLRLAHVPGAGHCIRRDQLQPYLEVVRSFLANIAQEAG